MNTKEDKKIRKFIIKYLGIEECFTKLEFISETIKFRKELPYLSPLEKFGDDDSFTIDQSPHEQLLKLIDSMVERYKREISDGLDIENSLELIRISFKTYVEYMKENSKNFEILWNKISPDGNVLRRLQNGIFPFSYTQNKQNKQNKQTDVRIIQEIQEKSGTSEKDRHQDRKGKEEKYENLIVSNTNTRSF